MEILPHYNVTQFLKYVPEIRKNNNAWRLIEVILSDQTSHNSAFIANRLKTHFDDKQGVIFICNSKEILVLANVGENVSNDSLSHGVEEKMPSNSCSTNVTEANAEGLLTIQIRLQGSAPTQEEKENQLLGQRKQRGANVVMVVDDDAFMRSLVSKTFVRDARVLEVDENMDIVEAYLENLPDVLFLDIHLSEKSGMDIMDEILGFDDSAYIIMISADTVPDNVLTTKKMGAKGFVAKPFNKERLIAAYNKCPTITAQILFQDRA